MSKHIASDDIFNNLTVRNKLNVNQLNAKQVNVNNKVFPGITGTFYESYNADDTYTNGLEITDTSVSLTSNLSGTISMIANLEYDETTMYTHLSNPVYTHVLETQDDSDSNIYSYEFTSNKDNILLYKYTSSGELDSRTKLTRE